MKFLKKNFKIILAFIAGVVITGGIVYATTTASEIIYTREGRNDINSVADALNDLYNRMQKDVDDIIISNSDNFTTTQKYSKIYVVVTRMSTPVFKRQNVVIDPIKTRSSLNNDYYTYIYSVENVNIGELWEFKGTAELFCFE